MSVCVLGARFVRSVNHFGAIRSDKGAHNPIDCAPALRCGPASSAGSKWQRAAHAPLLHFGLALAALRLLSGRCRSAAFCWPPRDSLRPAKRQLAGRQMQSPKEHAPRQLASGNSISLAAQLCSCCSSSLMAAAPFFSLSLSWKAAHTHTRPNDWLITKRGHSTSGASTRPPSWPKPQYAMHTDAQKRRPFCCFLFGQQTTGQTSGQKSETLSKTRD